MLFKCHNISIMCGQIWYFFRNIYWHILGSFSSIFTVLDSRLEEKKTTTAIPRFFDVCESGSAEAVLFEKSIFLHSLCISLQEPKRSNGCAPVWPEVHHWSRALSKACLLVFHKWTLYFPNTYIDPEIQALTRLSRERGVLKGCFTSRNVGWIQYENSKLVKSTFQS